MPTRVLLVEDNALNRDMLSRRLTRRGYVVTCAETGEACLELASVELPEAELDAVGRIDEVGDEIAGKVGEIAVIRGDAGDSAGGVTRLRSKVDGVFGRQMTGLALRVLHVVGEAVAGLHDLAHPVSREDAAECLLAIENAARRILQVLDQHHDPSTDLLARTVDPLHPGVGATVLPIRMARRPHRPTLVPSERRVLVVDDEQPNAELMARWLHRLGDQVAAVGSGREALDMVRIANWDAILLDIVMPGIDGIDLRRRAASRRPAQDRLVGSASARADQQRARSQQDRSRKIRGRACPRRSGGRRRRGGRRGAAGRAGAPQRRPRPRRERARRRHHRPPDAAADLGQSAGQRGQVHRGRHHRVALPCRAVAIESPGSATAERSAAHPSRAAGGDLARPATARDRRLDRPAGAEERRPVARHSGVGGHGFGRQPARFCARRGGFPAEAGRG